MPTPINIVLADDHLILSQGCKSLLETESDFKVVGANSRAAVDRSGRQFADGVGRKQGLKKRIMRHRRN